MQTGEWFKTMFAVKKPLIGMVHLPPLPGSAGWQDDDSFEKIIVQASADTHALREGGIDAVIFENFHDMPYPKNRSSPLTVGAMAIVLHEVLRTTNLNQRLPFGINVLRNDWQSALALARLVGACFVRINVLSGAMVTDQGIIEGEARAVHNHRKMIAPQQEIRLFADVMVKHASPITSGPVDIAQAAADTAYRAMADALIISGAATGKAAAIKDLKSVKATVPDRPILIGSGLNPDNAAMFFEYADGAIVGSNLKIDGDVRNAVDPVRVQALVKSIEPYR